MSLKVSHRLIFLGIILLLTACQTAGENLRADVYSANQVNKAQEAKVIEIIAVMPAKVEADNTEARNTAQIAGTLLGAIGGALIGRNTSSNRTAGATLGAVGGGVGGAALGSLVSSKTLVDGVSLTYKYKKKVLNSAQVGKLCEYKVGKAVMISSTSDETRVQPNAVCPEEKDQ